MPDRATTFLLLKKGNPAEPNNYRPITCLSVVYKLFTSLNSQKIQNHCWINKLIGEEQKGCIKGALGRKHQLTIDAIVLKQEQVKKRNIHMCYIDYTKAFDSVPHDWLIKTLEIYKISQPIIDCLLKIMATWRTNIRLNNKNFGPADLKRGIIQDDSLSPIWFCLSLNPLSSLLN